MTKPTNGQHPTIRAVDSRLATVDESAAISDRAVIGAPAEWRDRETIFSAHIGPDVTIREFAVVHGGCDRPTVIGARTLVCSHAYVGHDAHIGEDVEILPGARLLGLVTVHNRARIGAGAILLPGTTVGEGALIGAGAVVTKGPDGKPRTIAAGETWVGVPARRIR
jgi:acetyltransferase-like isoleucine patch superfamily enzyme